MKLLYLIFLLIPYFCIGQGFPIDSSTNKVSYKKILTFDTTCSKEDLHKAIMIQIANTFNDGKSVVQLNDKESGKVICKGVFTMHGNMGTVCGYWHFTLTFDIKGNRCRILITDIHSKITPGLGYKEPTAEDLLLKAPFGNRSVWDYGKIDIENSCDSIISQFSKMKCKEENEW